MDIKIPMSEYQRLLHNETVLKVLDSILCTGRYTSMDDVVMILKTAKLTKEGK